MWTMEGNDHGHGNLLPRPLKPRPSCTSTTTKRCLFSTVPNSPCFCIRNPNILSWKHPLSGEVGNDCFKKAINSMPLVSTRWNPTPGQLQALEEMYKRGTRTPSAQQIQKIAAKLRRFGKIEGRNVFYWFQNHKARERQKKRRQIELQAGELKNLQVETKVEGKPTAFVPGQREYFGIDLPTPTSCSTLSERTRGQEGADQFSALGHRLLLPSKKNNDFRIIESVIKVRQTLQLFPVKGIDLEEIHQDVSMGGTKFAPNGFIEFLPTKN